MLRGAASHVVRPSSHLLYTSRASSSSSSSSSSTPRSQALTQPQKNLYRALEPLSKPTRQNPSESQRRRGVKKVAVRKPQELLAYAQWFVDESRHAAQPPDVKGKAKETAAPPTSSLFEHSPSSWALLLRAAAHVGDGRAFVSILDAFARWKNELRQDDDDDDDDAPSTKTAMTLDDVQSLAAQLAFHLRSRHHLGDDLAAHPAMQLPFMVEETERLTAARYHDGLSPAEIQAIFLRPLPVPRSWLSSGSDPVIDGFFSSSRPAATSHDVALGRRNHRRPRLPLVTWLSTVKANSSVRKQLRDLMAIFRQAYDNRCVDEEALTKHLRALQTVRQLDHRTPGPSALTLESLGSLDDPESLLSLLVKREALANAVISSWLRQQGGADAGPPPWLLAVALRTFAQRGDSQRIRDVIAALKQQSQATQPVDAAQQPPAALASDLFEAAPHRRNKSKRPARLPIPPRILLNQLLLSHQVGVVDADSGRRAFKAAWLDLRALCGDPRTMKVDDGDSRWAPDEGSILILLDLLRYDARRVRKGLRVVRLADASWGHGSPHMRRMLDEASSARRKDDAKEDQSARRKKKPAASLLRLQQRRAKRRRYFQREHRKTLSLTVRTASVLLRWIAQQRVRVKATTVKAGSGPDGAKGSSPSSPINAARHAPLVFRLTHSWLQAERKERAILGHVVQSSLTPSHRSAGSARGPTQSPTVRHGLRNAGWEWARFRRAVAWAARKEGMVNATGKSEASSAMTAERTGVSSVPTASLNVSRGRRQRRSGSGLARGGVETTAEETSGQQSSLS